jgi:hypothetical protein
LLTDGEFDPGVLFDIQAWNKGRKLRIPIHTIAFVSSAGEPLLQEIAKQTGGKYRFVP